MTACKNFKEDNRREQKIRGRKSSDDKREDQNERGEKRGHQTRKETRMKLENMILA